MASERKIVRRGIEMRKHHSNPSNSVGEWLDSLVSLEGRGVFAVTERQRLKRDQRSPGESNARRGRIC
jgi:hypothetical protein